MTADPHNTHDAERERDLDLCKRAQYVIDYHAKQASYGGASFEMHARMQTTVGDLRDTIATLRAQLATAQEDTRVARESLYEVAEQRNAALDALTAARAERDEARGLALDADLEEMLAELSEAAGDCESAGVDLMRAATAMDRCDAVEDKIRKHVAALRGAYERELRLSSDANRDACAAEDRERNALTRLQRMCGLSGDADWLAIERTVASLYETATTLNEALAAAQPCDATPPPATCDLPRGHEGPHVHEVAQPEQAGERCGCMFGREGAHDLGCREREPATTAAVHALTAPADKETSRDE